MTFPCLYRVINKGHVGLSGAADQDGDDGTRKRGTECQLPCQPEDKKERAVKFFRRFSIDAADHPSNAVTTEYDQFISHDLRPEAKPVLRCGFDQRSEQKPVLQVRRNGANQDCRKVGGQFVSLNNYSGPRPSEVARDDHQYHIAPRYFHDSQS
jgi:hypothetical protein